MKQAAKTIFMLRPKHFGFDVATAASNAFQNSEGAENKTEISQIALKEFDNAVSLIRSHGIDVVALEDTDSPVKPNAVFPNNWVSFHESRVILYPMLAENRRDERRLDLIEELKDNGVAYEEVIDISHYESEEKFLESTGSIVLDYPNQLAYACLSGRTHNEVLNKFCELTGFEPIVFESVDKDGQQVYHTNVMMCLAEEYAIICMDSILDDHKPEVLEALRRTNHEVIPISMDQMYAFAGNMFEVSDAQGGSNLIMSESALKSLSIDQKQRISEYSKIISVPIPTIEKYGGGSIRCMMCRVK